MKISLAVLLNLQNSKTKNWLESRRQQPTCVCVAVTRVSGQGCIVSLHKEVFLMKILIEHVCDVCKVLGLGCYVSLL